MAIIIYSEIQFYHDRAPERIGGDVKSDDCKSSLIVELSKEVIVDATVVVVVEGTITCCVDSGNSVASISSFTPKEKPSFHHCFDMIGEVYSSD